MEWAAEGSASSRAATSTRIVRAGWLIAIFAVAAQTLAQVANTFLLERARPGLDAAADRNAFDWMSFGAGMVAALSLLLLSLAGSAHRKATASLALFVAFLATDDVTNLHDRLGTAFAGTLPAPFDRIGDWSTPVLYLPLLSVTFGLLCRELARAALTTAIQIRAALVLLAGAVALRVLAGALEVVGVHVGDAMRAMGVSVLEGAELGAWVLLASAFSAEAASLTRRSGAATETAM